MLYRILNVATKPTKNNFLMSTVALSPITTDGEIQPSIIAYQFNHVSPFTKHEIVDLTITKNRKGYPVIKSVNTPLLKDKKQAVAEQQA